MSTNLKPPKSADKPDRLKFSISRLRRKWWALILISIGGGIWTVVEFLPNAIDAVPKVKPAIEAGSELMYPAKITINTPKHNSIVPLMVTFEGTAKDIPTDLAPWLCIYAPEIERYYYEPIELPAATSAHQQLNWKTDPYPIGDREVMMKESRFQVSVVLLNNQEGSKVNRGRSGKKKGTAQGFVARQESSEGRESKGRESQEKSDPNNSSGWRERRWREGSRRGEGRRWERDRDPKEGFMGQCLGTVQQRIDLTRPAKGSSQKPEKTPDKAAKTKP